MLLQSKHKLSWWKILLIDVVCTHGIRFSSTIRRKILKNWKGNWDQFPLDQVENENWELENLWLTCWWKSYPECQILNEACYRTHQNRSCGKLEMRNSLILVLLEITSVFGTGCSRKNRSLRLKEPSCDFLALCIQMKWKGRWKDVPFLRFPGYQFLQSRCCWSL